MQVSLKSSFTAFDLTVAEERSGYNFNEANKAVIQNLLSAAAEEFIAVGLQGEGKELILSMDEKLRVAELRGTINILKYLLQVSDATKQEVQAEQDRINNPSQDPLL